MKLGKDAGHADSHDFVLVRGPRSEVERAVREINSIVESAKNDEIDNSYVRTSLSEYSHFLITHLSQSIEFDIDREYVGRIVGTGGAGVNRIRDQLGVKVDFSDDNDDRDKEVRKKKLSHHKAHVKVCLLYD